MPFKGFSFFTVYLNITVRIFYYCILYLVIFERWKGKPISCFCSGRLHTLFLIYHFFVLMHILYLCLCLNVCLHMYINNWGLFYFFHCFHWFFPSCCSPLPVCPITGLKSTNVNLQQLYLVDELFSNKNADILNQIIGVVIYAVMISVILLNFVSITYLYGWSNNYHKLYEVNSKGDYIFAFEPFLKVLG